MQSDLEREIQQRMRDVLVDFDHTICQTSGLFNLGPPMPGVRAALQDIRDMGLRIVVWSSRFAPSPNKPTADRLEQVDIVHRYMVKHKLPFDEIDDGMTGKRFGLCGIDDRGIAFRGSWGHAVKQVREFKEEAGL